MRHLLLLAVLLSASTLGAEDIALIDAADPGHGWSFDNGREFPGAEGSLAADPATPKDGKPSLRLVSDLTRGGNYVQMSRNVSDLKLDVEAVSFWLKAPGVSGVTMRLIDGSGRCHQIGLQLEPPSDTWRLVSFPIQRFFEKRGTTEAVQGVSKYECWGGPKNLAEGWHGALTDFVVLAGRPKDKLTIWMSGLVASVRPGTRGWSCGFEDGAALPAGWRSEGSVSVAAQDAFEGANALVLARTAATREKPCSVTSAIFPLAPGVWDVGGALAVALESPDASYCGALHFEILDASGAVVDKVEIATPFGAHPWQVFRKQVRAPFKAANGRFVASIEKTVGAFRIDALSAKPLDTSRKPPAIDRIVLSTRSLGNLLLPEDPRVYAIRVEAIRELAESERQLTWSVRDYWGAEQAAPATVTLTADGRGQQNRLKYVASVDLAALPLEVGRYYEMHAQVALADSEPFRNSSGFAIVPVAASKTFTPAQIPFTARDWDNRLGEYISLADRLGFRIIGLWGGAEAKPPYKANAPGIEQCAKLGAAILTGCPADLNSIEYHRPGYEQWTDETTIRGAIHSWFAAFGAHQPKPIVINLGNEPHGTGEQVVQQVKAYKIAYDQIKKDAPDAIVVATSVEPNEEYFKAGYQDACDAFDFHIYEAPEDIRKTIQAYQALMKKYHCEKPLWATEIGLNSQGLTRQHIAGDMIRKFATFFAAGGVNMNWFDLLYPDGDGKALGTAGDSFNLFDSRYNAYAARLDAVACYNLINGILDKHCTGERAWPDGIHGTLFRNDAGKCFAMLWKDAGRADIALALAGTAELQVIRIDGRRSSLKPGAAGFGLSVGVDPLLLAYDGPATLPERLGEPLLRLTAVPERLMRGAPGVIEFAGKADPQQVQVIAPPGWMVERDKAAPSRFHVTSPEQSAAREGDLIVRLGGAGAVTAELSCRPLLTGRLAVEIVAQRAVAGGKPVVKLVVSNQSAQAQTVTWSLSLTGERAMVGGHYAPPVATSAFLAESGNGTLTLAANGQSTVQVPLGGVEAEKLYQVAAAITDATGGTISATSEVRDLLGVSDKAKP